MNVQWIINIITSDFIKETILVYGINEIFDVIKGKIISEEHTMETEFFSCLDNALSDTCIQLEWEYDSSAVVNNFLIPLTCPDTNLNKEYLFEIFKGFVGHPVTSEDLKVWTNCFLRRLASEDYSQLREYLKLRKLLDDSNTPVPYIENNDDYDEYLKYFRRRLFWGINADISLQNLYVWNTYCIGNSTNVYQDLPCLLSSFFQDKLDAFLYEKNISQYDSVMNLFIHGYPGCGKTSLVSKIASLYSKIYRHYCQFYFINMAKLDSNICINNILDKLDISEEQIKGCVLILDSIDEAVKNVENIQEILENMTAELYDMECKCIMTCRSNLININILRHSIEINLQGFSKKNALFWLNKYHMYNQDFNLVDWQKSIKKANSGILNIILIPLIFYICVVRNINIEQVDSIGKLYDILFDISRGQIATTSHRNRTNHKNDEWIKLRNLVRQISVRMYQKGYVTVDEIKEVSAESTDLEKYFGIDLYIYKSSYEVRFIHSSMWQYFFAEIIYDDIIDYDINKNIKDTVLKLSYIFITSNTLDDVTISFLQYFMDRDYWMPTSINIYINLLMGIDTCPMEREGSRFELTAMLFREMFKIVSIILDKYYKDIKKDIFAYLANDMNRNLLIKYTNSSFISPLITLKGYNLSQCKLKGINLSYTNLYGCAIRKADLKNACLRKTILTCAYLDQSNFISADFQEADLKNADLEKSMLCCCDFRNARLNGANFYEADLYCADLRGAKIEKTKFDKAKIQDCKIDVLQMRSIGIENILKNNVHVYQGEIELSNDEIEENYKELNPVSYAFWKKRLL